LLINLLSIFSDGIAVKKRKLKEFQTQTAKLLKDEINTEGADVAKLVTENSGVFKEKAADSEKQLNLLDPKKQIINIFPTFFYSLLLIILYGILTDKSIMPKASNESVFDIIIIGTIGGSIFFAIKGVTILKKVVWAIIEVKQEMAQENQQSKSDKINSIEIEK
jgi:hypothetical protein